MKKRNSLNKSKKLVYISFLVFGLISNYVFYRLNNSLAEQVPLYIEYNMYPDKIITPIDEILLFEDEFPNISNVLIPIKLAKARYLFLNEEYEKAKQLIHEGNKHNPYLGFGELLLNRIFTAQNKLDSAVYYGKESIRKLPKNESHITFYQITQEKVQDLEEITRVFTESSSLNSETIWQNYLISLSRIKLTRGIDFTLEEKEYLNQALSLFPKNKTILIAEKIINYGGEIILIANDHDSKAIKYFKEKNYKEAIEEWLNAIQIIKNDEAYYLNIAHAYILLDQDEEATSYLKKVETLKLIGKSGKFEFLSSIINLKKNKTIQACNFAKKASELGYRSANSILEEYKCFN